MPRNRVASGAFAFAEKYCFAAHCVAWEGSGFRPALQRSQVPDYRANLTLSQTVKSRHAGPRHAVRNDPGHLRIGEMSYVIVSSDVDCLVAPAPV